MVIGFEDCGCPDAVRERRQEQRYREEEEREVKERPARNAGIPPRYRSIKRRPHRNYIEAVQEGRSVIVHGSVGTGKTHFACGLALAMVERGYSVRFTTSTDYLRAVKASYDRHESEQSAMYPYLNAQVLVLDDLGQEKVTDWALEKLFDLVNYRYNHLLPMVVTIQTEPSKLCAHFEQTGDTRKAEALVSRMQENAIFHEMTGGDRRLGQNDHA